jgi:hypothetical protein
MSDDMNDAINRHDRERTQAIEETEKRAQELVFLEWMKYRDDAMTTHPARRRAYTAIADSLQQLLEQWSEYGHKLVWSPRSILPK